MTVTDADVVQGEITTQDEALQQALDEATLDGTKPTELIHIESRSGKGLLTIDPNQTDWTPAQRTSLKSIGIETEGNDAVPIPNVLQFLHICQIRDLDPFLREAYLIVHGKINVGSNGKVYDDRKFTLVVGIDGFRKRGEDTGEYAGQVGPEWCGEDMVWKSAWNPKWGAPVMARVGIMRKGFDVPVWGVAAFEEFVPMVPKYEGRGENRRKVGMTPTDMWLKMPANQIAKCAEAQAFRKTFPRQMSGMYEPAEMQRAETEYQQQQIDARNEQSRQVRMAAYAAAQAGQVPVPGEVVEGAARAPEQPVPDARAGEPVPAGQAVRETVEQMRAGTRAPRGATRAPASAVGSAPSAPDDAQRLDWARAEAQFQAGLFGKTLDEFFARQSTVLKKLPGEFTADELLRSILPLRAAAVEKLRKIGRGDEAAAYETVPSGALMPLDMLVGTRAVVEVDPTTPHEYADQGGVCEHCGREEGESIHPV
jgi:phage recombination protein Bet